MIRQTCVAVLAPVIIASAPQSAATSERATLMQLTFTHPNQVGLAERRRVIAEEIARLTSCRDALQLAHRLKARGLHGSLNATVRFNFPLDKVPPALRNALRTLPVGRATPLYGDKQNIRTMIRCEADFKEPGNSSKPASGLNGELMQI